MHLRRVLAGAAGLALLVSLGFMLGWNNQLEAAAPEERSYYADLGFAEERWSHLQGFNSQETPPQDWDGTVDGAKTLWYPNGVKYGEGLYRDNVKEGPWTYWHENGEKRWEGVYSGGEPSGLERAWYDNGQRHFEGAFEDEEREGPFTFWYENGQMWWQGEFDEGEREGRFLQWNEDGSLNLALSGMYSDNRRVADLPEIPAGERVAPR